MSKIRIRITKEDVEQEALSKISDVVDQILKRDDISFYCGLIELDMPTYSCDLLAFSATPEVIRWYLALDDLYPYLLYFLNPATDYDRYCSMFVPAVIGKNGYNYDKKQLYEFVRDKGAKITRFCMANGMPYAPALNSLLLHFNVNIEMGDIVKEVKEEDEEARLSETMEESTKKEDDAKGSTEAVCDETPDFGDAGIEPQKVANEFLLEVFSYTDIYPLQDITEDPALFVVSEDPVSAFRNPMNVSFELFKGTHYPIIFINLTIYDSPDFPSIIKFPLNAENEDHRKWLVKASELGAVMTNTLFRKGKSLYWAFTAPVNVKRDDARMGIDLLYEADAQKALIPSEYKDFDLAIDEYAKAREKARSSGESVVETLEKSRANTARVPAYSPQEFADDGAKETQEAPQSFQREEAPASDTIQESFTIETDSISIASAVESETVDSVPAAQTYESKTIEAYSPAPDDDMTEKIITKDVLTPFDRTGAAIPEEVRRIEKMLNTPVIKPDKPLSEDLSPKPGEIIKTIQRAPIAKPQGGMSAAEMDSIVARMSKKIMLLESRLETKTRENKVLSQRVEELQRKIEKNDKDSGLLKKSSWWKLWDKKNDEE